MEVAAVDPSQSPSFAFVPSRKANGRALFDRYLTIALSCRSISSPSISLPIRQSKGLTDDAAVEAKALTTKTSRLANDMLVQTALASVAVFRMRLGIYHD